MAYVVEKAGRHYAVIYEGTNPITGRERRRWYRCPSRAAAEALARGIGTKRTKLRDAGSAARAARCKPAPSWFSRRSAATAARNARPPSCGSPRRWETA
jgi:hypothetical protein